MKMYVKSLNLKRLNKRLLSFMLAATIVVTAVPDLFVELWNGINSLFVSATSGTVYTAPECEFLDELYNGSDAISPLPTYAEYVEKYNYEAPKLYSLTEFRALCGEGLAFDVNAAGKYKNDGYKIMICNAAELYLLSQLCNTQSAYYSEAVFYLSANYVLGNNIEYSEMSLEFKYLMPIGNEDYPFTGTFDGQCFEIRDLYYDTSYSKATIALFGVVAENAKLENFGLYHPYINASNNSSTYISGIAAENYGTIDSVYVIVEEYTTEDLSLNALTSANAASAAGLVARNSGTLSNSYFAGMLNAINPAKQNPVCAVNDGTIINCYYDSEIFAYGTTGTQIDTPSEDPNTYEIIALTNLNLKKIGYGTSGMINTKFKRRSVVGVGEYSSQNCYDYPRLYGFTGTGTESDPFLISTPADLINFPNSIEYISQPWNSPYVYYFALANCIDMNTVAPNAYEPKLSVTYISNYLTGGKWEKYTNNSTNRSFYGIFSGAAHGEDNCSIHHVDSLGNDYEGNPLQESHIILNLTIDTPAEGTGTSNSKTVNKHYTAFIAQSRYNSSHNSGIENLQFVGGYISSGTTDCLPASYNAEEYNVCTATVIANASYTDLTNVHSSATVTTGIGQQYSIVLGGLVAYGTVHYVTDCTNSGNIIGGYVDMVGENITATYAKLGGLLGAANVGSSDSYYRYQYTIGKLTHVANYGTVSAVTFVTNDNNSWALTSGSSNAAGISMGMLSFSRTCSVTSIRPYDSFLTYIDDSTRADRIANFGVITDVPVELDKYGKIVYESENKPKTVNLESGKRIVEHDSPLYQTYLYGIGSNYIAHAYNAGNIYSLVLKKTTAAGIGCLNASSNCTEANIGSFYNYENYNHGNVYFYNGASAGYGVSTQGAYMCYNDGSINVLGGTIVTGIRDDSYGDTSIGTFSGICRYYSYGCYNNGTIYLAPTSVSISQRISSPSYAHRVAASGTSFHYSAYCYYKDSDGQTIAVRNINNGSIVVDLKTNCFVPIITNGYYAPAFYMNGTGSGGGNDNYGTFDFIPYSDENYGDYRTMVGLYISACGSWYGERSSYESNNYADIYINCETENCLCQVNLTAFTQYGSDCVNYGNIMFNGIVGNDTRTGEIYLTAFYSSNTAERCINLGDITLSANSNRASVYVWVFYGSDSYYGTGFSDILNGWYDGCSVPAGFMEDEYKDTYQEVFDRLDKNKRYGQINVSGDFRELYIYEFRYYENSNYKREKKRIFNNGSITVRDIVSSSLNIYALSNNPLTHSENHAPIEAYNFVSSYYPVSINGGAPGSYNVNYADIDVHDYTASSSWSNQLSDYARVDVNGLGVGTSDHLENRGNITVNKGNNAVIDGVEYTPGQYVSTAYVSGIGRNSNISNSINFGNIISSGGYISGIGSLMSESNDKDCTISNCINYGNLNGGSYVGGISAQVSRYYYSSSAGANTIMNCANFGEISGSSYLGGICGYGTAGTIISACSNYADIIGNNSSYAQVGGIIGYSSLYNNYYGKSDPSSINCCLNYGDLHVSASGHIGGIVGQSYYGVKTLSNCINYGDLYVEPTSNSEYCGGLVGYIQSNKSDFGVYRNAINYGTVNYIGDKVEYTYVGSLIGNVSGSIAMNHCVDLSKRSTALDNYSMFGNLPTSSYYSVNYNAYALDAQTIADTETTVGTDRGTAVQVTFDNDTKTGLYSPLFPFRSLLWTGIGENYYPTDDVIYKNTEVSENKDNLLVYVEYDELSPYLQSYMVEHFGEQIKNYGAYVVLDYAEDRSIDTYFPQAIIDTIEDNTFGAVAGNYTDTTLLADKTVASSIYANYLNTTPRTIQTDLEYYATQVQKSSLAEAYAFDFRTSYQYKNMDSSDYQYFDEHLYLVQTYPAYKSDGTYSDTVLYTDVNVYIGIDDADSQDARYVLYNTDGEPKRDADGNIIYGEVDTNGALVFHAAIDLGSKYSTMKFYKGDTITSSPRLEETEYYIEEYPHGLNYSDNMNINFETLQVLFQDDTLWTPSISMRTIEEGATYYDYVEDEAYMQDYRARYDSNNDGTINGADAYYWEISIPYNNDEDALNSVYTKVLGVATAEDGIHQNIITVHVYLGKYKAYAELNSVKLQTTSDDTVISTTENNKLKAEEKQPSLSDESFNDVTYYYMLDDGLEGENIQTWVYSNNETQLPALILETHNMDEDDNIKAVITRHEQTPVETGKYNDMVWNTELDALWNEYQDILKDSMNIETAEVIIHPTDVEYDENQLSTGKATLTIPSAYNEIMFYGGFYRVDLYYERTKGSGNYKHFATVFIAKEYSPSNTIRHNDYVYSPNPYDYNSQLTFDAENPTTPQTGSVRFYSYYENFPGLYYFKRSRSTNDSNAKSYVNGRYYALKAYCPTERTENIYLSSDNAAYNYLIEEYIAAIQSDEEAILVTRGVKNELENQVHSVYMYRNEATGASYPSYYKGYTDVMAENGDIRKYDTEHTVRSWRINVDSAMQNSYPIIKNESGSYVGEISGTMTEDVTFNVTWKAEEPSLYSYYKAKFGYKIFYTSANSDETITLIDEEIDDYFDTISTNDYGSVWTIKLKGSAPAGTYEIMPCVTSTTTISSTVEALYIYDATTGELIDTSEDKKIEYTVPFSSFIINNNPNYDAYLTEFDVNNDLSTPYIFENTSIEGSESREVYIRTASTNQEIVYEGYEDYRTGDNRIDSFTIYSYVDKESQTSTMRFAVPYNSTMQVWTGTGSPNSGTGEWVDATIVSGYETSNYKQYTATVTYNDKDGEGAYTYNPSITYYRVIAEDNATMTQYKVYVIPGVRNKATTLEVAQSSESSVVEESMKNLFEESDKIYQEILEKYGSISAVIKELDGSTVDVYQTKIFTDSSPQSNVYNLKSFVYDIDVSLPVGYTYDVYLFSEQMDKCQKLKDSENNFAGKQLIINSVEAQTVNLRIVLRRINVVWGVQYIWTFGNAVQGGIYNSYVS